jgi:hypothetical protein
MIERFIPGKQYRFIGNPEKVSGWNYGMDFLFTGIHKCIDSNGMDGVQFENEPGGNGPIGWDFRGDENNFEELSIKIE